MNCHQTRHLVSAYADQELTGQQMLEIKAHLRVCPECEREWREINDVRQLLRALSPPSPPRGVGEKLTVRLQHELGDGGALPAAGIADVFVASWRHLSIAASPLSLPRGRSQTRLTVYALALSTMAFLAAAAPFAPPGGDAAGNTLTTPAPRLPQRQPAVQFPVRDDILPSLRFTAGAAGSVEADPLRDDTISGYMRGEATMINFETSGAGAR